MTPQQKYNRTPKGCYVMHKSSAKQRGVDFNLSFDEWWGYWEPHFDKRGLTSESYQMCRYGDKGGYELGNVYMATLATNRKDTKKLSDKLVEYVRRTVAAKEKTQTALAEELGVSESTISFVVNHKGVYCG